MASFGDVKTAFLHAPLPSTRKVFLRPPSTEPERLWKALKAIYGLREAPSLSRALGHDDCQDGLDPTEGRAYDICPHGLGVLPQHFR
eukprot:2154808-Heterocapsa_arctica.AAC.1